MKKKNRKPFEQIQRLAFTAQMPNEHIRINICLRSSVRRGEKIATAEQLELVED